MFLMMIVSELNFYYKCLLLLCVVGVQISVVLTTRPNSCSGCMIICRILVMIKSNADEDLIA